MSGAATVALASVGAARGRWRFLRRRLGTVWAGPWAPAEADVRVLLEGGPGAVPGGASAIVVEDGGALAIGRPGRRRRPSGGVAAAGRVLWLCAGSPGRRR